jgi:putative hydrolase of the HAD superfamily|tara:strand:- start:42393 stop:42983 length:591 start_codon:yes stop_codon:yes gene_type:complete
MVKTVIFDADGMIVNGERFSSRLEREYGISTDTTDSFFKNEFQLCLVGKADLKQELLKNLDQWGWNKGVDELLDYWFSEEQNRIDNRFSAVIRKLREKHIKTYLATNNEKYRTRNLLEDRRLGEWFDDIFSSAYVGSMKPNASFFQHILDKTGAKIEETVFWDDDIKNTDGAASFGLSVEVYKNFEQFKKAAENLM